jgi:preprotein translocase subunit SecF
VELFREVSIDWLAKKWYFFGLSWILIVLGIIGYFIHGGLTYGIDFTGGTLIYLKFDKSPDLDRIRRSLKPETVGASLIQRYGDPSENSVLVRMQTVLASGQDVDRGQREVASLLRQAFDPQHVQDASADFNNVGMDALDKYLLAGDPDNWKAQNKTSQEIQSHYQALAQSILDYRNRTRGGLVPSLDDLRNVQGTSAAVVDSLKKSFYAGPFAIKGVESLGAVVGSDLRRRAALAVGLSFLGMLVYIGFRFKPIYGVGAIVALFHDLAITLGLFALTRKEISLTVVAALLTLVGYSVNDTIVVFDRVRENLRLMRKESHFRILNLSINQTLSRTIMTSGMTFLSVFALYAFGGEVLNGFAFALTVGIIVGTYSSIAIASPIVDWWYRTGDSKTKSKVRLG